jgi:ankyrin repeat protein
MDTLNVLELIKSGKYFKFQETIKENEEIIQRTFSSDKKSSILDNPYINIWKVTKDDIPVLGIFDVKRLTDKSLENVVITGPLIYSLLYNKNEFNVKNEVTLYQYGDGVKWEELELKPEVKITSIKKKYKSPAHVLLSQDVLKRCGYINGEFYCSSMFLVELQKHVGLMNQNFVDPIMKYPFDPFNVYMIEDKELTFLDRINKYDITVIDEISDYDELMNGKTFVEICIDKYNEEQNPVLLNTIKNMILKLSDHEYLRPPYFYSKLSKNKIIIPNKGKFNIPDNDKLQSIDEINEYILNEIIKKDSIDFFDEFTEYISYNKDLKNKIIANNSNEILKHIITTNKMGERDIYYCILMTQNLDLFKLINFKVETCILFLREVIEKNLKRSYYFLLSNDKNIINMTFENDNIALHVASEKEMISMIMSINRNLIDQVNSNNESPIIYHAKNNNKEAMMNLMEYSFDPNIIDNEGNSVLHYLCRYDNEELLKRCLTQANDIINLQNKNMETPLLICCIYNQEDMYYILRNFGAKTELVDKYGNTIYHYICKNKMCIGMTIPDKSNYFGVTPKKYSPISESFYEFE